jgi:deoxycytidylate deaminase
MQSKIKKIIILLNANIEDYVLPKGINTREVDIFEISKNLFFESFKSNIRGLEAYNYFIRLQNNETYVEKVIEHFDKLVVNNSDDFFILKNIQNFELISLFQKKIESKVLIIGVTINHTDSCKLNDINSNLLNTYLKCDYYINSHNANAELEWERIIKLIDNKNHNSYLIPNNLERLALAAYNSMFNSHCLSRAVGAALADAEGNIISTGWNDVPKAGGGVYESGDAGHCYRWTDINNNITTPTCHKDRENNALLEVFKTDLQSQGVEIDAKTDYILNIIAKKTLKPLLEFSRSTHAEMHTIMNAVSSAGSKIKGGTICITAYPCHLCAKIIILSGITTVIYLEPFLKSKTGVLHIDAILHAANISIAAQLDPKHSKVWVIPYTGIGGKGYNELLKREVDLKTIINDNLFLH